MRIVRHTDTELVLRESTLWISALLSAGRAASLLRVHAPRRSQQSHRRHLFRRRRPRLAAQRHGDFRRHPAHVYWRRMRFFRSVSGARSLLGNDRHRHRDFLRPWGRHAVPAHASHRTKGHSLHRHLWRRPRSLGSPPRNRPAFSATHSGIPLPGPAPVSTPLCAPSSARDAASKPSVCWKAASTSTSPRPPSASTSLPFELSRKSSIAIHSAARFT